MEGGRGGGRERWREGGVEGESLAWSKIMEISERLRTMRPRADLTVNPDIYSCRLILSRINAEV